MLTVHRQFSPQGLMRRWVLAFMVIAALWSGQVAVASTAMGCCDPQMACCTIMGGTSCNTCVPGLNVPSTQPVWQAPAQATTTKADEWMQMIFRFDNDIWRPPMAPTQSVFNPIFI